jgi:hypothetical protein
MGLPKAVQRAVEEADELVAQISGDKTVENQDPPPDPPPTETEPQDPPPDPPPAEPPQQTVSQEPPAAKDVPESKWESKYHTLKGMYDAEVPRLHAELREMKSQVQQLVADKAAAEAKAATAPEPQKSLITDADKEAFGPDLIDLIERATESKVSTFRAREAQLVDEIKQLKSQLGNVSERQVVSDKDRFLMGLSQRVSDWEQLNTDPGFLEWLQQVDPVYGLPRQAGLNSAYEAFDVARVATIFETYKQLTAPKQTQQRPKQELQRQVAPTRSRVSTPPAADAQNQKIFNSREIEQFYDEWRRGFIDNDEAVRMEKEIHAAIAEGRIR